MLCRAETNDYFKSSRIELLFYFTWYLTMQGSGCMITVPQIILLYLRIYKI